MPRDRNSLHSPARAPRWSRPCRAAALAAVVLAGAAARAGAQEAVWVASPHEQREHWYPDARAALEAEGVQVSEAEGERASCTPALARDAARASGAARGVCVRVERAGKRVSAVAIELAAARGDAAQGRAQAAAGDAAAAVRAAYREAEIALELDDDGLVRVRTTPEGAVVAFDGEPRGHAPLERRLAPGAHRIGLTLDGFTEVERELQVARGRVVDLDVRLVRSAIDDAAVRSERSPLNYIVGGALLAGAVPLLAISLVALARDGDCEQERGGVCVERVRFGTRSGVLLGAGVVALAAGTYLVLAGPIEVDVGAGPEGARVTLGVRSF